MRWEQLRADRTGGPAPPELPLGLTDATIRTFDTPEFRGITYYEVTAKTIINRVSTGSQMPFQWTINPYRGCSHACRYCFARKTHTFLDMDAGHDFDTRIVVKVNAPELLRRELAAARWRGEHIAMGTNVDCYQRAEGRYRLMPPIIEALRDHANPFSILTKGTLILRDLHLLRQAAGVTTVRLATSIGFVDERLWRSVEPGTPSPRCRLDVVRTLADAGFAVSVLVAPVLPGLTDSPEEIDRTVAAITRAGAASVTPIVLHLRPGAREWYLDWLARVHPELADRYRQLYQRGAYTPSLYQREITARVQTAAHRHGLKRANPGELRLTPADQSQQPPPDPDTQLTLL